MYVCMYVYVCMFVYVCMCMYVCMHACIYLLNEVLNTFLIMNISATEIFCYKKTSGLQQGYVLEWPRFRLFAHVCLRMSVCPL